MASLAVAPVEGHDEREGCASSGGTRPCPLCGTTDATELLETGVRSITGETYRVVQCSECDLRYTRPLPVPDELEAVYGQDYIIYHSVATTARRPWRLNVDALTSLYMQTLFWDRRRALLGRRPGRLLDVGCGTGDFLLTLKQRGWNVCGTEFSDAACAMARARGIPVEQAELASVGFPDRYFDVVTLWHVLEHLEDPFATLAEVRRILRDDGLLIVEVPNSACLAFRLCKKDWFMLEVPQHVQHFTPHTLRSLLQRAGFEPVYRQNLRFWNFHIDFYSFLNALRLRERFNIRYFSKDFARAPWRSKLLFAALAGPLALLSLPYSVLTTLLTGNAEIVTMTAHKTEPIR